MAVMRNAKTPSTFSRRVVSTWLSVCIAITTLPTAVAGEKKEVLQYHPIQVDKNGHILPWNTSATSPNLGRAYDQIIESLWVFWRDMRRDANGLPYYMNHQVWQPTVNDRRGLGGDQFNMALSSWKLLFAYRGGTQGFHQNNEVRDNMQFIADYYLAHSLSPATAAWPNFPYPYNSILYSGRYDGDMVIGPGYTQPDKAASFGAELVELYKLVQYRSFDASVYLDAATRIADTLVTKVKAGDNNHSPWPFKVHAVSGKPGTIVGAETKTRIDSDYTTNWGGALDLFSELIRMKRGNVAAYQKAFETVLVWMKAYPMKTNKWGPFFEDIERWSDTQINAVTWAQWIMEHREFFPNWQSDVRHILDWASENLGNPSWEKYGVIAINEQTAYKVPGNSHTSRQAAAELRFAELTGDLSRKAMAIRQLNWATYMVDKDGKNKYYHDEVWLTDGYGDYIRHYLRAMAAAPELAPDNKDRLLRCTGVATVVQYNADDGRYWEPTRKPGKDKVVLRYTTFEKSSMEVIRMVEKPARVVAGSGEDLVLSERPALDAEGWTWEPIGKGGVLRVRHDTRANITVYR